MRSRVHIKLGLTLVASAFVCSACLGSIASPGQSTIDKSTTAKTTAVPLDEQLLNAGISELGQKNYKSAIEDFNAAYALTGASDKTRYLAEYDLGVLYAQNANYPLAIQSFKMSLAINPAYSFSLNNLAILESQSDPQTAITLYERLLKTKASNRAGIYTSLGNLYIKIGNTKKGQEDLDIAATLNSTESQNSTTTTSVTPTS